MHPAAFDTTLLLPPQREHEFSDARRPAARNMSKALLLSIVFAMVALPARAAREKDARKGLRKALLYLALFNLFYLFNLMFLYGRL